MSTATDIGQDVAAIRDKLVELRRDLHAHPELAFEETWTAATLAGKLRALGLKVTEGIGGTGVLGLLQGANPGKTVLLRAEMDAVDMDETTGAPYASQNPGRNHCCGHDIDSAVVATAAEILSHHKAEITGNVAFLFQPADEPMRGVQRMIDDGLWDHVQPDSALALHVEPHIDAGQVVVMSGPIWSSRDGIVYKLAVPMPSFVPGGPRPKTKDTVELATEIVAALNNLVANEGQSDAPVNFRIRKLTAEQGGFGKPGTLELEVNLGLYDNRLRARLLSSIDAKVREHAATAGATVEAEVDYALPTVENDPQVAAALEQAANQTIGSANVIRDWRNPFADDISLIFDRAPGCMMLLGTRNEAKGIKEIWHTPAFDVDEDALPAAVQMLSAAALDLLRD